MLIFLACSWKKNMSLINMRPPYIKHPPSQSSRSRKWIWIWSYTLCYCREETVQHTSSHERFKVHGGSAPDGSPQSHDREPEQNGRSAEIGREHDSDDTTSAHHEHITSLGVVTVS